MFVHYRTKAFILKEEERQEADKVFTVFSENYGKLKISGKAIRKIKSKLRAGVQLFCLSEVAFIQGKALKTLTDSLIIKKPLNIYNDLERLEIASEVSKVIDRLVKGEESDKEIWELVSEFFERLDQETLSPSLKILTYHYFLWNFFYVLGYGVDLENCVLCQKKLEPKKLYLDSEQGGIVCEACSKKDNKDNKIDPEIIKILRILLKRDWKLLSKLKIEDKYLKDLEVFSEDYLTCLYDTLEII
jgi:DNA repair protein RecO (recombination protein O)